MDFELLKKFGDYGVTMLLLSVIVYYFHKRTEKLEKDLTEERESCQKKLDTLNDELRKSDRENIEIINKVTDVIEDLNHNNDEITRYLKSIRYLIKNKTDGNE